MTTQTKTNILPVWLISFSIMAVVLISCASPSVPELAQSQNAASETVAPRHDTALPEPTRPISFQSPLPDLPLNWGATWIYSDVVYAETDSQDIVTSTYIYSDTVIDVRSTPPYFAAEISRTASLIAGEPLFNAPEAETWWYVISGTQVYRQAGNQLDLPSVSSSWLEYTFPLTKSRWYPDPEIRKNVSLDSMISGIRYTFPESEVAVPAGLFKDCFMIATAYLSGATYSWFCPSLGVVAEKFDHGGTPFGDHAVLMNYSIKTSP